MIELKNICKKYGEKIVYDSFNLDIEEGKITAVLGESGSGKTTLLNIVANLTDYAGEINNKPHKLSYVFQEDRLIKNLTVEQNLKLICPAADIENGLKSVGLFDAKDLYPKELSAGMSRRVSILRAYLYGGDVLLMDEPFINLDIRLKYALMDIVNNLQKQSESTVLFVTHDIKEAVYLADRVVVISSGKIISDMKEIKKETEEELFDLLMHKSEN